MKWNLHQLRQTVPHRIDRALRAILGSPSDYAVEARSGHSRQAGTEKSDAVPFENALNVPSKISVRQEWLRIGTGDSRSVDRLAGRCVAQSSGCGWRGFAAGIGAVSELSIASRSRVAKSKPH
jgi:hypothetical protein